MGLANFYSTNVKNKTLHRGGRTAELRESPRPDPRDVSVLNLPTKIVCTMVDQPEFAIIETHTAEDGASFAIRVHADDIGKIIGRRG